MQLNLANIDVEGKVSSYFRSVEQRQAVRYNQYSRVNTDSKNWVYVMTANLASKYATHKLLKFTVIFTKHRDPFRKSCFCCLNTRNRQG